ncbi:MAG: response regulator transcription factor [Bdellovibrionales bacterium]|nr:response regulator transcription factor [Bdellovibrionales bacterium]
MSKILIVEDDKVISDGLKQALESEGYQVACAFDGDAGLYKIKTESPDLVILDIMMPNMNGFEVTTEVRRSGDSIPIMVLSARVESQDKVRGLDLGADDYISKPFDLDELLARVRRLIKKQHAVNECFGDFEYIWKNRTLCQSGLFIQLQTKERLLLEFFLKRANQIVSREQILDSVWGSDYEGTDRTVDNLVVALRKKLGSKHVITERGLGYRFVTKL